MKIHLSNIKRTQVVELKVKGLENLVLIKLAQKKHLKNNWHTKERTKISVNCFNTTQQIMLIKEKANVIAVTIWMI